MYILYYIYIYTIRPLVEKFGDSPRPGEMQPAKIRVRSGRTPPNFQTITSQIAPGPLNESSLNKNMRGSFRYGKFRLSAGGRAG